MNYVFTQDELLTLQNNYMVHYCRVQSRKCGAESPEFIKAKTMLDRATMRSRTEKETEEIRQYLNTLSKEQP